MGWRLGIVPGVVGSFLEYIRVAKKALITGITGQDGSYLAEHLLELGYEVHGIIRRIALEDPTHRLGRISHILDKVKLHSATLESYPSLVQIMQKLQPHEVYHLAAQSFVAESFEDSFSTLNTNINGTHYLLAAIHAVSPYSRLYFAGTSEMFGKVMEVPQKETTPFRPRSPYGISKLAGYELVRNYRESYNMYCCSGILFNHESPRRGFEFVTRKITSAVARIKHGKQKELMLGNLEAQRDWGHAKDYVKAMHLMLQQPEADDFVIATGETHYIRDFADKAFKHVGLNYKDYVKISEAFFRPAEVELLIGDPSKAREKLGWKPTVSFDQLIVEMVDNDMKSMKAN
jgi:GDPmannose 4,6-dehydratase